MIKGKLVCCNEAKVKLDDKLISDLNTFCEAYNVKVYVTSGVRCLDCNKRAGGVDKSPHLFGRAVDVKILNPNYRFLLLYWFIKKGYTRFGIGKEFIHIDNANKLDREGYPEKVIWIYEK